MPMSIHTKGVARNLFVKSLRKRGEIQYLIPFLLSETNCFVTARPPLVSKSELRRATTSGQKIYAVSFEISVVISVFYSFLLKLRLKYGKQWGLVSTLGYFYWNLMMFVLICFVETSRLFGPKLTNSDTSYLDLCCFCLRSRSPPPRRRSPTPPGFAYVYYHFTFYL